MLRSFIEKQQATYDFAFERPVPDRRELSAATLRRWVLASLLGMLAIGCNEILGNTPHGIDADASLEGGSVPRASINGRALSADGGSSPDGHISPGNAGSGAARMTPPRTTLRWEARWTRAGTRPRCSPVPTAPGARNPETSLLMRQPFPT